MVPASWHGASRSCFAGATAVSVVSRLHLHPGRNWGEPISACLACAAALQTPLRAPLRTPMRKPTLTMGLSKSITDSFPALVAGAAVVGATPVGPALLTLDGPKVSAALALTMLAMGTTLETAEADALRQRDEARSSAHAAACAAGVLAGVAYDGSSDALAGRGLGSSRVDSSSPAPAARGSPPRTGRARRRTAGSTSSRRPQSGRETSRPARGRRASARARPCSRAKS